MSAEIVMPRLSDTMEEGTILRWLKRSGEQIARGEEIVETDKASMPYAADLEGTLEIIAREGETLPVGAPIARVASGATRDDREQSVEGTATEPLTAAGKSAPAAQPLSAAQPPAVERRAAPARGDRIKASPLA